MKTPTSKEINETINSTIGGWIDKGTGRQLHKSLGIYISPTTDGSWLVVMSGEVFFTKSNARVRKLLQTWLKEAVSRGYVTLSTQES